MVWNPETRQNILRKALIKYGDKKGEENHIKYREKIVGEKAKIQN